MAGDAVQALMDVETFLTWGDGTDTRHELIDGHPVAMAPPSEAHSVIVGNLAAALRQVLPPGCRVAVEAGIRPPHRSQRNYYQADIVVICGGKVGDGTPPCLVVEVLSDSTMDHDRGRKLHDYQFIETVREVLLVWSDERRVQLVSRVPEGWLQRNFIGDAVLPLASLGAEISLEEIYQHI
ncbi:MULTISPECIES: Uma2 family endonuclease [unclassified Azospirillum]|uniref:Uma2 family endonuclease n=1 Tax=unclassified Azospirillum TaxID=2630922 RepID=UPI000B75784F|nr:MULTISPECIES: Uma2 family endonuclease [unclassified Azospirillum]SNR97270.1 Endonuclease, Uma2 family (restriction endonuclease fold) [Azospirillum sp. RU38E]SNS14404.1 Endonuclease, Uma2 family (restriction endonuclease fold) [Azospirillum sp. RU37A]